METIQVQDVFDPQAMHSLVLPEDDSLESIIARLAEDQCLRGVFLVDSRERFAGVITRADLLKWAYLRLGRQPGGGRVHISRRDLLRLVLSTTAQEVAHGDWRTLGVQLTDDLEEALNQMFQFDAIEIPVLDRDGRILGDLKLSQLLLKAIETARQE